METQQFIEKIQKRISFSSEELEDLVSNAEVERICLNEPNKWDFPVLSIVKIEENFYSIYWEMTSTEFQDDSFESQIPQEVQHVIHPKVVKEWITT